MAPPGSGYYDDELVEEDAMGHDGFHQYGAYKYQENFDYYTVYQYAAAEE